MECDRRTRTRPLLGKRSTSKKSTEIEMFPLDAELLQLPHIREKTWLENRPVSRTRENLPARISVVLSAPRGE